MKDLSEAFLMRRIDSLNKRISNEAVDELIHRNAPIDSTEYFLNLMAKEGSKPGVHEFGEYVSEKKIEDLRDKNSFFTLGEDGKPKLYLKSFNKNAVHTSTQEEYDFLMQFYESGKWKGMGNKLPTELNYWKNYEDRTHVDLETNSNLFSQSEKGYYDVHRWSIVSLDDFMKMQKISDYVSKKINEWFEEFHPYRKSKGESILK